jgi:hypothetical protein
LKKISSPFLSKFIKLLSTNNLSAAPIKESDALKTHLSRFSIIHPSALIVKQIRRACRKHLALNALPNRSKLGSLFSFALLVIFPHLAFRFHLVLIFLFNERKRERIRSFCYFSRRIVSAIKRRLNLKFSQRSAHRARKF